MELAKIRSLSDEELAHQDKTSAEQLFRLRFQVSLGQNDGVKKLRQVRKEIAHIKTVARERHLGIRGAVKDAAAPAAAPAAAAPAKQVKTAKAPKAAKTVKAEKPAKAAKPAKKGAAK